MQHSPFLEGMWTRLEQSAWLTKKLGIQLRDSTGLPGNGSLATGFAFKPTHPGVLGTQVEG